jgi:hypothetical protein
VSLIRKRAQVLGYVDAPSREIAEAAAASAFSLTASQHKRLVVQERAPLRRRDFAPILTRCRW